MSSTASSSRSHLILILGDIHSPHRTRDLPAKFKEMLSIPGKIHYVLCTGNLCSRQMEKYLRSICSTQQNVFVVRGDMDQQQSEGTANAGSGTTTVSTTTAYPTHEVVQIGSFRFGLVHGHQIVPWNDKEALAAYARKLNVDVLISGHTHDQHAYDYQGRYFINPGSATGAYTPLKGPNEEVVPAFVLVQTQGEQLIVFKYQLKQKEGLVVQKSIFQKNASSSVSS